MSIFDRFTQTQQVTDGENRRNASSSWGPSNNGKAYRRMFSRNSFVAIGNRLLIIEVDKEHVADIGYNYTSPINLSQIKDIIVNVSEVKVKSVFRLEIVMFDVDDNNRFVDIDVTKPDRFIIPTSLFEEYDVDLTQVTQFRIRISDFLDDEIERGDNLVINELSSISYNNFIDRSINRSIDRPINKFINFGKYKNRTFRYIIKHDKDYCNWVLNTAKEKDSSEELKEFARYIQN